MNSGSKHHKEAEATLATQIKETERQLWERQRFAHLHTDIFVKDLEKELTSPTTLLLIGELGFIIGELTKPAPKTAWQAATADMEGKTQAPVTPLRMALDFKDLLLAFYKALPLVWIMDTFHPEWASRRTSAAQNNINENRPSSRSL